MSCIRQRERQTLSPLPRINSVTPSKILRRLNTYIALYRDEISYVLIQAGTCLFQGKTFRIALLASRLILSI